MNSAADNCGAIGAWVNASLNVHHKIEIVDNIAGVDGGGLVANGFSRVNLSDEVVFLNNVGENTAGAFMAAGDASVVVANHVRFEGNVGHDAGGAFAVWTQAKVTLANDVTFKGNTAPTGSGGAVCAGDATVVTFGEGCVLSNNSASSGGAIAVADDSSLLLVGKVIMTDNNSTGVGGAITATGNASVTGYGGTVFLNNTAKSAGSDIMAEAGCRFNVTGSNIDLYHSSTVLWYRKGCVLGEVLAANYCQPCPPLTYGLDPSFTRCSQCPANANCSGRDALLPLTDFWHSSPYSTQMHSCPRKGVCLAGGGCAPGYMGHVCGSCAADHDSTGPFKCGRCMSPARTTGMYLGAALALFLLASLLVHTTLKDNQLSLVDTIRPSDVAKILVRHAQYLAIVAALNVHWPASLDAAFTAVGWVFAAGSPEVVSLGCHPWFASARGGLPLAVGKVLAYLMAPMVLFIAVLSVRLALRAALALVRRKFRRLRHRGTPASLASEVSVSLLVVLLLVFPFLVRAALSMFACLRLDVVGPEAHDEYPQYAVANASAGYFVADLQQPCWVGWHRAWALGLGLPCAVLLRVGVPLLMGLLLFVNRAKMGQQGTFSDCMAFMYHNYRPKRCLWEVVNMVQITTLTAIAMFAHSLGTYYSTLLLHACFAAMFVSLRICKPYAVKQLNSLSLLSVGCLYITASIFLTFIRGDMQAPAAYAEAVGVFGLVVNAGFVLLCCALIINHSRGMLARGLAAAKAC